MEEILLFVGIARRIWLRRNEVVHGGSFMSPNTLMQRAKNALEDFLAIFPSTTVMPQLPVSIGVQRWRAPESSWVKVGMLQLRKRRGEWDMARW